MKCPRCHSTVDATPDGQGIVTCPQCGARLRRGSGSFPGATDSGSMPDIDSLLARSEPTSAFNPNATLPPGTPLKKIPRPGEPGAPDGPPMSPLAHLTPPVPPPALTLPAPVDPMSPASLQTVIEALRALQIGQEEILSLLRGREIPAPVAQLPMFVEPAEPAAAPTPGPLRSRRRKTVLLIDDDPKTRAAAVATLEQAQVPVRSAADGQGGLAAIAAERPDVIALELAMGGSMGGKDVINMIKATMEWVDIPILLYTRANVQSQKEARIDHGADEFVLKGQGGPESLVAKVIALFRKS
jgi:CheY-like chemotaxis protein